MNLSTAQHYAAKLVDWIAPHCAVAPLVAGSIRRRRPVCNDVDIVCIPKTVEERDMFGTVTSTRNLLHEFLRSYVAAKPEARFQSGGDHPGKMVILQLPKCQLDLWFATESTLATRLMCRTGSKEHNVWLAQRAKRWNWKWNPYEGIVAGGSWVGDDYVGGEVQTFDTEAAIYNALDLPFIEPENRELGWLVENFGA